MQYSKSPEEIKQAISQLQPEVRERYTMILNIVKDAHELEKNNSTQAKGFDKSRLSLESSKQLESLAYEVSKIKDEDKEDENKEDDWMGSLYNLEFELGLGPEPKPKPKPEPEPDLDTVISIFRIEEQIQRLRGRLDKTTGIQSQVSEEKEEVVNTSRQEEAKIQPTEKLEAQKQQILERPYMKKSGIPEEFHLSDILDNFSQKGLMLQLLEQDVIIEEDELQYQSELHGVSHTRRVNFFAMAIMDMENVTGRDREIILQIVKNHDIGRINDDEDKEHGGSSVKRIEENEGRLEGFNEEEQEIIKFVIQQHSKSTKENQQAISQLPEDLKHRYSLILNIFKDADKLDRVRLDRQGYYPSEGLDVTRLSLECSKKLENVAYEACDKLLEILDIEKEIHSINNQTLTPEETQNEFVKTEKVATEVNEEQILTGDIAQSIDLWMKRFRRWNSVIDRVSQKAKAKFVKMKSDILKAIKSTMKERSNPEQGKAEDKEQDGIR